MLRRASPPQAAASADSAAPAASQGHEQTLEDDAPLSSLTQDNTRDSSIWPAYSRAMWPPAAETIESDEVPAEQEDPSKKDEDGTEDDDEAEQAHIATQTENQLQKKKDSQASQPDVATQQELHDKWKDNCQRTLQWGGAQQEMEDLVHAELAETDDKELTGLASLPMPVDYEQD